MKNTATAIRAVAALFARRIYLPVLITTIVIAAVVVGVSVWLITIDPLWLLLAVPLFLLVIIVGVVMAIIGLVLRFITPTQTKAQRSQVTSFVDKLQRLAEVTATPKFILLFRTAKDAFMPSREGYIQSVVHDTTSLKKDFDDLRRSFDDTAR